jgi:uncharacterized protein (TIGR02265 family)
MTARALEELVDPQPPLSFIASSESLKVDHPETWEDLEARIAKVPPDAKVRGMFLSEVHRLVPRLNATRPRYIPFTMYPVREYMGLLLRATRARHPSKPPASALLELGFGVYSLFAESLAGTAIMAATNSDFARVCQAGPKAYGITLSPGSINVVHVGANEAMLQLRDIWVFPEVFHTGIWLGAMMSCKVRGTIEVTRWSPCDVDYHMHWRRS